MKHDESNMEYISILSVISAFAVVSLHTNGCFWEFSMERYWVTANILESLWYFAVPVFFMISGATLMDYDKKYNLIVYFKKRIHKTVVPFIFWSLFGLLFKFLTDKDYQISKVSLQDVWNGIFDTSFVPIYWFFIPLFICYLCIPVFAAIPDRKRKTVFSYMAGITFLCNAAVPFFIEVFQLKVSWPFHIDAMGGYLIFLVLGYLANSVYLSPKYRYVLYFSAALGLFAHIIGTYELSISAGKIIQTYKGYLNVPCIIYSVGIFFFIKENATKMTNYVGGTVEVLRKYTFAVYILHYFVMVSLVKWFHIPTHALGYRVIGPFIIGAICILLTFIIRKLPFGKFLLP